MSHAQSGPEDCLAPPCFWSRHNSRKPPSPHLRPPLSKACLRHACRRYQMLSLGVKILLFLPILLIVAVALAALSFCTSRFPCFPWDSWYSLVQENQPNTDLEVVGTKCVLETHAANLQYKNFSPQGILTSVKLPQTILSKTTRRPRRAP